MKEVFGGDVVLPGSDDYERIRKPALARFWDIEPAAVVRCRTAADVAQALAYARRSTMSFAVRGGGHCFAGSSSTTGIVIDTTPMNDVEVGDGVATIGAGARLGPLYDALDRHGVTIPGGCGPTVGIAGLALGGGLGMLGRSHGLTCDRLRAAQIVLADGRVVVCDEQRHGDLFWALRGAGNGRFGVVTSLTFATLPAPMTALFELTWPRTGADALIAAWQEWAPDAPDELTAGLRVADEVTLFGTMLEGEAQLDDFIARAGVAPTTSAHERLSYREAKRALAGLDDGAETVPVHTRSEFFRRPLPPEAIAALVQGDVALHFTPMGGAYNRVAPDATAFVHRRERFLLEHVGDAAEPVARSWELAHPWGSGRFYPNFPDPDVPAGAYYGENADRLAAVKRTYDPDGVFHALRVLGL
jgi:FAD/FMN-containing dehydrogenase